MIAISPIVLKFFELNFYNIIDDFLEEKFLKYSYDTQFGFMHNRNCNMAKKK